MIDNYENSIESLGKTLLEQLSTSDSASSNKSNQNDTQNSPINLDNHSTKDSLNDLKKPSACCIHAEYFLYYFTCKELNKKLTKNIECLKKRNRHLEKRMKQLQEKYELEKAKNSKRANVSTNHRSGKSTSTYNSMLLKELDELIDEARNNSNMTAKQILNDLEELLE